MKYEYHADWYMPHECTLLVEFDKQVVDACMGRLGNLVNIIRGDLGSAFTPSVLRCFDLRSVYAHCYMQDTFGDYFSRLNSSDFDFDFTIPEDTDGGAILWFKFRNKEDAMLFKLTYGGN